MSDSQMSSDQQIRTVFREALHQHWIWFLVEGIILLVLGTVAILAASVASLAMTLFLGWILLLSGVAGLVFTFRARHVPGFSWSLLSAALGIIAGALLLGWPVQGVFSLTVVLIAFLLAEGIVSIFYALEHQRGASSRWGWMLASGVVDIILGAILWSGLPGTATWALGVLVGVNMIFGGWALVFMALSARSA